ncbi:ComEA family DNA-binding protein [Ructibacterium gallinarum]|uniref:Helix-hairpin-helix domain-containing protein n=1 Tax=Ructibacterium gallinarum TaxID=2779355 RepID=A0A9D5M1K7_9FIRM|nr:helix-hairpin-helix domain-containing protein [Ructibacterium gallinarum]MBE5038900.1 helix-hairpin-helix domain-containing protein [Ructibacterium gallinarum]
MILLIAVYMIGLRLYQNRSAEIVPPETTLTPTETASMAQETSSPRTEEEEDRALAEIEDKININTATESELCLLDGIGEVLSKRIIEKREELGGFQSIDQLHEVQGIGDKLFEQIKNYVTVE